MNKKFISALSLSSLLAFSTPALADQKFYIGIDANSKMINADSYDPFSAEEKKASGSKYFKTQTLAPNIFAGFDNGESFKVELGYNQNSGSKTTGLTEVSGSYRDQENIKNKLDTKVLSLDFRPYRNINDSFLVYAIAGLSYVNTAYKSEYSYNRYVGNAKTSSEFNSSNKKVSQIVPTIGFGTEFKMTKNFFTRAQVKYSHINQTFKDGNGDKTLKIKGATDLALGVGYYF